MTLTATSVIMTHPIIVTHRRWHAGSRPSHDVTLCISKQELVHHEVVCCVFQVASLIFVAEWGDRSMLATIALGAAQSPVGGSPVLHTHTYQTHVMTSVVCRLSVVAVRFQSLFVGLSWAWPRAATVSMQRLPL